MREQVGLLLVAFQRLPRRRLVGRARGREARLAGVGPQVRREVREVLPARRVLRIDPVSGAQADARAGHTRLHAKPAQAHHDSRPQGQAQARPGAPRLHEPGPHLQARGRHHLPAHRRGLAVPGDRDRPEHAHGGRVVAVEPHDRRHRGGGAGIRQIARIRGGQRHIPHGPRRAVHQQASGRMGARQRRAAFLQPHGKLPRQRRRRVVLRHAEERDVLPQAIRHQGRGQARSRRVHRGVLQQAEAAFLDRLQGAGRSHGRLLRADRSQARLLRAARSQARRDAYGSMIPLNSVSEILTQVSCP